MLKIKKFAVIGKPVAHSLSPVIHQSFAKQFDLNIEYSRVEVSNNDLNNYVRDFFVGGGSGLNITAPYKQQAYQLVNIATPRAQLSRAINTIKIAQNGTLFGDNTDGVGLVRDLNRNSINLRNKQILILGAGGATRGILPAILEQNPGCITLVNRNLNKAKLLAEDLKIIKKIQIKSYEQIAGQNFDIIINATSADLTPLLPATSYYYDLNYLQNISGLGMLVEQAAEAFCFWHGMRPHTESILAQLHQRTDQISAFYDL